MDTGYDYHVVGTVHNFGVFKNSGKKVILQIDFRTNKINIIKRGTIQYKCDFDDLSYDSEEGVMLCIKIGGKHIELTAENLEEKTAICRLLSIVQSTAVDLVKREARDSPDRDDDVVVRTRAASVIKEGVLEKKGNATIQIWAKRKVKVTPGMFSYFKTDEKTALNVVPLKPNQYKVKSVGHSGFNVVFPKRTYYFRLTHTSSSSPVSQTERDEWIRAFSTACQEKRRTIVDFESCGLESSHQPDQKFLINAASFTRSDDSLFFNEEDGKKTENPMKSSETQTNSDEKLSEIVPQTETLKCVTKDRPKKNSGEKQPLVAVKSLIAEENEEELNSRNSTNEDDRKADNTAVLNDFYDVVKDLRYSSSEDNISVGHEEMVTPEGDYAFPEEIGDDPLEDTKEEENAEPTEDDPMYDDIKEETDIPKEARGDEPSEGALYAKVSVKQGSDTQNKERLSGMPTEEDKTKEKHVYATSLKRRQSKKESTQQRVSLPPPPPPPLHSLTLAQPSPPSATVTDSNNENANKDRNNSKRSLDRPLSLPPPPPPPPLSDSHPPETSDELTDKEQINTPVDVPNLQAPLLIDRRSASSYASDLSQHSAEKSDVFSEDGQERSTGTSVSESPRERLSLSQTSDSSVMSETFINSTEHPLSSDTEPEHTNVGVSKVTNKLDEKTDSLKSEGCSIPTLSGPSESKSDGDVKQHRDSTEEAGQATNQDYDTIAPEVTAGKPNEEEHQDDKQHHRSSIPVKHLPQWPPISESNVVPPPPPPPIPSHFLPRPPVIPQPPTPPPTTQTKSQPKKLRTLHWSKLNKSQVKASFWKHATDRCKDINTDLIKEHFCIVDEAQPIKPEQTFAGTKLLLDATRARNLGIILTGLKAEGARHIREVINSVSEDEYFPAEKLTTIRRYQPTTDDIELFKLYSDKKSTLDPVDRFMCELCEIDCIGTRLDFILLLWDFPRQLACNHESLDELSQACSDLKTNTYLMQLMEYILAVGNFMNGHQKTHGFPITSLRMFMDMRGKTTDFTFSHFLVELLEEKDPEIIKWTSSMENVAKCKNINIKALVTEIEVLKSDLTKLKKNLKTLKSKIKKPKEMETDFLHKAQHKLVEFESSMHLLEKESANIQTSYRHLLEYFGEVASLPSNELFSVLSDFAEKFRQATADIDRRKRYRGLPRLL